MGGQREEQLVPYIGMGKEQMKVFLSRQINPVGKWQNKELGKQSAF